MKVLWFSLSPGLGAEHINDKSKGLGWIKALEQNIQDKVELSIVFYQDGAYGPFTIGTTKYFPIKKYNKGKISKIKNRLFTAIELESDVKLFLDVIDEVKPDVIHIHGTEAAFGLIQKFCRVPVVISIQGTITVYRYKFFSAITHKDVIKFSSLKSRLFLRTPIGIYKRFIKIAVREKEIYANSKHFIGRTAWDRRVTAVLAPTAKYYHNDEILRSSFYTNKWVAKPTGGKLILFTTNGPDIYKGIETLLECATLLDTNKIDYEWRLAGLHITDDVVKIAAGSTGKPISKSINFMGKLDEQPLLDGLLHSHIYINISHIENSPNSLCEAQILGLPCIATFAGGTSSLLEDNKEGILIQDGDPYSMAGAIMELWDDYDKAIAFGKNSRERALRRHDPLKITNDLLEIYKNVVNGN